MSYYVRERPDHALRGSLPVRKFRTTILQQVLANIEYITLCSSTINSTYFKTVQFLAMLLLKKYWAKQEVHFSRVNPVFTFYTYLVVLVQFRICTCSKPGKGPVRCLQSVAFVEAFRLSGGWLHHRACVWENAFSPSTTLFLSDALSNGEWCWQISLAPVTLANILKARHNNRLIDMGFLTFWHLAFRNQGRWPKSIVWCKNT